MLSPAKKIQRTSQIISILAKYGFKDLLSRLPWSKENVIKESTTDIQTISLYERIRLALEELGPAFVKLGQAATTREGLLPEALVIELSKLEDKVEPVNLPVEEYLEKVLNIKVADWFQSIEKEPFAAASISQVYKAITLEGEVVVIKIKRPGIDEILSVDLVLMKDLADMLSKYSKVLEKMNLPLIVDSFANSLMSEISLDVEKSNIERFTNNFKGNKKIYIPELYSNLSNNTVLCMEFINGNKATDTANLLKQDLNLKEIAARGLYLYLEQVLVHGFFHGDPHPGNLLVLSDGRLSFLDFGNMGTLSAYDKRQLEDFVTASVEQDAVWLGEIIEDIALYSNVEDRKKYERTIIDLFEIMNNVSIGAMDLKDVFSKVWKIIGENQIHFPEHIYQLIRGISLLEGIGKKLDPELNIMDHIRPFTNRIVKEKLNPKNIARQSFQKVRAGLREAERIPEDLKVVLKQLKKGELSFRHSVTDSEKLFSKLILFSNRVSFSILFLGLCVLTGFLVSTDPLRISGNGISVLSYLFLILTFLTGSALLILLIFKRK